MRGKYIREILPGEFWLARAGQCVREVNPEIIVGMCIHDNAGTLSASLQSVFSQKGIIRKKLLILIDDGSTDGWRSILYNLSPDIQTMIVNVDYGNVSCSRNSILYLARTYAKNLRCIIRLDADDLFYDDNVIHSIEKKFSTTFFSLACGLRRPGKALLASNYQRINGIILPRPNIADTSLIKRRSLIERLEGMAAGDPIAELPSCNVVLGPEIGEIYPSVSSAEDHWLTVKLLTSSLSKNIMLDGDIMHSIYSLSGKLTQNNRINSSYYRSRRGLLTLGVRKSSHSTKGFLWI